LGTPGGIRRRASRQAFPNFCKGFPSFSKLFPNFSKLFPSFFFGRFVGFQGVIGEKRKIVVLTNFSVFPTTRPRPGGGRRGDRRKRTVARIRIFRKQWLRTSADAALKWTSTGPTPLAEKTFRV
jgi:hypothetical protein